MLAKHTRAINLVSSTKDKLLSSFKDTGTNNIATTMDAKSLHYNNPIEVEFYNNLQCYNYSFGQ